MTGRHRELNELPCQSQHSRLAWSPTLKANRPVSAKFGGAVTLSEIDPPNGYTISGEGQGGVAGFAKGGAKVSLAEDGTDTVLSFTVNAQVGGKIAQLGARLIDATAKQMAEAFFDRFTKQVIALAPPPPAAAPDASPGAASNGPVMPPSATRCRR
jgi:hypothetical protein